MSKAVAWARTRGRVALGRPRRSLAPLAVVTVAAMVFAVLLIMVRLRWPLLESADHGAAARINHLIAGDRTLVTGDQGGDLAGQRWRTGGGHRCGCGRPGAQEAPAAGGLHARHRRGCAGPEPGTQVAGRPPAPDGGPSHR